MWRNATFCLFYYEASPKIKIFRLVLLIQVSKKYRTVGLLSGPRYPCDFIITLPNISYFLASNVQKNNIYINHRNELPSTTGVNPTSSRCPENG
jgi:hypothetical protein